MTPRLALFCAAIVLPSTALAEGPSLKDLTPDAVYARGGVLNLAADGASFLKMDIAIGVAYTVVPDYVTGRFEFIMSPSTAAFKQGVGDGLTADTEWNADAFVALLGYGRLAVFRRSWIDVGASLSYEATIVGGDLRPTRFSFIDESGTYDLTTFAKEHAKMSASYKRLSVLLDVRVPIFDIWTAYASAGLTQFSFDLNLSIDDTGKELIESIGQNPSAVAKQYDESYTIPVIQIGSDVDIPDVPIYLNAEVHLVPVSIEQLFLGANLSIGLRL